MACCDKSYWNSTGTAWTADRCTACLQCGCRFEQRHRSRCGGCGCSCRGCSDCCGND